MVIMGDVTLYGYEVPFLSVVNITLGSGIQTRKTLGSGKEKLNSFSRAGPFSDTVPELFSFFNIQPILNIQHSTQTLSLHSKLSTCQQDIWY